MRLPPRGNVRRVTHFEAERPETSRRPAGPEARPGSQLPRHQGAGRTGVRGTGLVRYRDPLATPPPERPANGRGTRQRRFRPARTVCAGRNSSPRRLPSTPYRPAPCRRRLLLGRGRARTRRWPRARVRAARVRLSRSVRPRESRGPRGGPERRRLRLRHEVRRRAGRLPSHRDRQQRPGRPDRRPPGSFVAMHALAGTPEDRNLNGIVCVLAHANGSTTVIDDIHKSSK